LVAAAFPPDEPDVEDDAVEHEARNNARAKTPADANSTLVTDTCNILSSKLLSEISTRYRETYHDLQRLE